MKFGKIWGTTRLIYKNDNFEVHELDIKKGAKCSKHLHRFKHNMFFVMTGILNIKVWKNDYNLIDTTKLFGGEKTTVKPNEYHQFECEEDATALEIYYTEPIGDDIIRESVGSK